MPAFFIKAVYARLNIIENALDGYGLMFNDEFLKVNYIDGN